jgi:transposase
MRGEKTTDVGMWSYVSAEQRVPSDHPLRPIKAMIEAVFVDLSRQFDELYSDRGRPSIPPEHLLSALVLQIMYSIRSERQLMEQLNYNLLFRWFCDLNMDDPVWDVTVFTKNRDRLLGGDVAKAFFARVLSQAREADLLSDEHFTVDGTMIEAWAGQKSFVPKSSDQEPPHGGGSRNPHVDYHGQRRKNAEFWSTTDRAARMYRKGPGKEAKLCYFGHLLTENRNGLIVDARVTMASGFAEREAALEMAESIPGRHRATLAADKGYDTRDFVDALRKLKITPHVACNVTAHRDSAIDGRTTRHEGYKISQRLRKRIEECYGWMKTIGPMRKTKLRGRDRVDWQFTLAAAVYNLTRLRNLTGSTA